MFIDWKHKQRKSYDQFIFIPSQQQKSHYKSMLVILLDENALTKKIETSFLEYFDDKRFPSLGIYAFNALGNIKRLQKGIEYIKYFSCDAIFTIGAQATILLKKELDTHTKKIPIIFGGVKSPIELKLIQSLESSDNYLTGVTGVGHDYKKQIDLLLLLKKNIKKVILIYQPGEAWINKEKTFVENYLHERAIITHNILVYNKYEVHEKLEKYLQHDKSADALITFRSTAVLSAMQQIADLCKAYKVPLLASDLCSLNTGAALAFGSPDEYYGSLAAPLAHAILEEGKHPSQLPIVVYDRPAKMRINVENMRQQGLYIPENLLTLMERITINR